MKKCLVIILLSIPAVMFAQPNITAIEYFFNTDPGPGNGTPLTVTPGTTIDLTNINIATTSLAVGWHTLHVRARDANNVWGFYESRQIYVRGPATPDPPVTVHDITQAEFFYDMDNGPGTGTAIPITVGQTIDLVNTNLANSLPLGWHTVHVRTKNANNVWGFYESRQIFVRGMPDPPDPLPSPIVELEWFVDADPGAGLSTTKKTISPSQTNIDLVDELLDVGTQSLGAHRIYVRAKNEAGQWSMSEQANFTVVDACPILNAPSATGVARCDAGPVTLTASDAQIGETYRWYATDTSVTPLFTGNPYTTTSLSTNTTFYVTAYNPTTFCESGRTPVTASISGIAKPVLNINGSLNVCEGTTQVLTAPPGFVGYIWSNGLTTQQITVTSTGSYSVVVNNGVCSSPPSDPFTFTVNAKPAKPTISASNGGSLCGVSFVTLSAPAGLAGYSWSSGQNTSSIDVTLVGSYAVTVTNTEGCQSLISEPFTITSGSLVKPTISIAGNTAICPGSTVSLSAPGGFSNYTWSNGENTEMITVSSAGSYSVIVGNGVCSSTSSDAVATSLLTIPPAPTIQITGSTSLCNGAFAGLIAPGGFGHYLWSNGETSRQIIVGPSSAGDYSVQVGTTSHCLSPASNIVTLSSTGQPCSGTGGALPATPEVADASRCGTGSVAFTANGATSGQEYRWYTSPTGSTSLAASESFETPELTTTTDYYVAIYDPITSAEGTRSKATARIINLDQPTLSPAGNVAICEGSSLLLSAPAGFATYQWRKDGVSMTITNQQMAVSQPGTYTVETGDGVCLSSASLPTTIVVDKIPTKPVIAGALSICGNGQATLEAPAATGYLWSNNEVTASVQVPAGVYSVTVFDGTCSNSSEPVTVVQFQIPAAPAISVVGKEVLCVGSLVALSAPAGFNHYLWSNGVTTQTVLADEAGTFSVRVGSSSTCLSNPSAPQEVRTGTLAECGVIPSPTNRAPVITPSAFAVQIQSTAMHELTGIIGDEDNNVDWNSLQLLNEPNSNGKASGGIAYLQDISTLILDYRGINFAGKETLLLQVCDLEFLCVQQPITIEVVGDVLVYNGITPDGDGINDFMFIQFIDIIEGARKNAVSILNRSGDIVFELKDYNNADRIFDGTDSNGNLLPAGTYLYRVVLAEGKEYTGFVTLKR